MNVYDLNCVNSLVGTRLTWRDNV